MSNMKASMQVLELFPTPVFVVQTEGVDNEELARQIYAIRDEEVAAGIADKTGLSNYGGFRSYDLLPLPGFAQLKQLVLRVLNECMVNGAWFAEPEVTEAQFGAMWGVINGKGHANSPHNHPGSWISGVYYPQVPAAKERAGSLCFRDPILARTFTRSFYRNVQAEAASVVPEVGKLIMFPSWVEHHVGPNLTDEDRIAIAFNIDHAKAR